MRPQLHRDEEDDPSLRPLNRMVNKLIRVRQVQKELLNLPDGTLRNSLSELCSQILNEHEHSDKERNLLLQISNLKSELEDLKDSQDSPYRQVTTKSHSSFRDLWTFMWITPLVILGLCILWMILSRLLVLLAP